MYTPIQRIYTLMIIAVISSAMGLGAHALGVWQAAPEIVLSGVLVLASFSRTLKRLWTWPLLLGVALCAHVVALWFTLNPAIPVALALASTCLATLKTPPHWSLGLQKTLFSGATVGAGMWLIQFPEYLTADGWMSAAFAAGWVGALGVAWTLKWPNLDRSVTLPSWGQVQRSLQPEFRPPVRRAFGFYRRTCKNAPDPETRSGLKEVALWVYTLQKFAQRLAIQMKAIDADDVEARIESHTLSQSDDPFTQERRNATVDHLNRLLDHRKTMALEAKRTHAIVEYALAFLEEANASITVSLHDPGAFAPERLPTVLTRLRNYSQEQQAQKETKREINAIQVDSGGSNAWSKTQAAEARPAAR